MYLQRQGITREEAETPRESREDLGGDKQQLVLAFFDSEDAADKAAEALRHWEKASEYMKVDAIGVIAKDDEGKVKEHKLGRRAGKKGMVVGVSWAWSRRYPQAASPWSEVRSEARPEAGSSASSSTRALR